jgi:hypothetical protein
MFNSACDIKTFLAVKYTKYIAEEDFFYIHDAYVPNYGIAILNNKGDFVTKEFYSSGNQYIILPVGDPPYATFELVAGTQV